MQDLTNGRINTNNLTSAEWDLVDLAYYVDWFTPSDDEWLLVRNLLGLFDLRRGYSINDENVLNPVLQAGTAQIRLNEHGREAWELKDETGKFYQLGKPNTLDDFAPHMTTSELDLFDYFENMVGVPLKSLSKSQREVFWKTDSLDKCNDCELVFEVNRPHKCYGHNYDGY